MAMRLAMFPGGCGLDSDASRGGLLGRFGNSPERFALPARRIPAAIAGATGAVGQRFIQLLDNHPIFDVVALFGKTSKGQGYADVTKWMMNTDIPVWARDMIVDDPLSTFRDDIQVVFSAVPTEEALELELNFAERGLKVFSNAAAHRMNPRVPILVAEINSVHLEVLRGQSATQKGWIVTNGNCTSIVLAMALAPLQCFDIRHVHAVSQQALSGAGYPGESGIVMNGNVKPFIKDEEEKLETEPLKILGSIGNDGIEPATFRLSATCTRVPVDEGHTIVAHIELRQAVHKQVILQAWYGCQGEPQHLRLPSAPDHPIILRSEDDRPQPKLDWLAGNGMSVSVGRLRADTNTKGTGWKFIVVGSNTIRGAAGGSILNAELCYAKGLLGNKR